MNVLVKFISSISFYFKTMANKKMKITACRIISLDCAALDPWDRVALPTDFFNLHSFC